MYVDHPRLRPIEVFPFEDEGRQMLLVHDPAGLAAGQIAISPPALVVLSLLDGDHDRDAIREAFSERTGQPLPAEQLDQFIRHLDDAFFLDSEAFAAHFAAMVEAYRSAPARVSPDAASYGADGEGLPAMFQKLLSGCGVALTGAPGRRLAGLVAPHLDYPRGGPCYADAYGILATADPPRRVVILGTNHFGRATSVVATRKDFQTPLGTTRTDRAFLDGLEARCGHDLCEHEFDHQREHSVDLQVLLLQHVFGPDRFEIVPVLCHDPCGPTGTAAYDGQGCDLRVFAEALGELVRESDVPTLLIAGADLSHVGRRFGDDRDLEPRFLAEIERCDREALDAVVARQGDRFVDTLRSRNNRTRVCSAGCIYALMTALPEAQPELLRYHQAVHPEADTAVTCSAVAFWEA